MQSRTSVFRIGAPALVLAATLAGCSAQDSAPPAAAPPPVSSADDQSTCGANRLASFIGAVPSAETLAQIKAASGAQSHRVVGPNDMMTMDFRSDRLTIETGADGRIKQFRCV